MTDTAQGPGWWQAADGRWYSPEQHPSCQPPPPSLPGGTQPTVGNYQALPGQWDPVQSSQLAYGIMPGGPPPKANPMAVASLVLSLVWLGGLGSLLAVIFGISAHRSIKASQGRETGGVMATAGIVVGVLGLLGAIVLIGTLIAVGSGVNQLNKQIQSSEAPTTIAMGTKEPVGDPANTGIDAVTVDAYAAPVSAGVDNPPPDTGKEYAVAKVEICAGSGGSQEGVSDFNFSLGFTGGQVVQAFLPLATPDLGGINGVASNACATGYVTFEIVAGTVPAYVAFQPGLVHQYRWQVPG